MKTIPESRIDEICEDISDGLRLHARPTLSELRACIRYLQNAKDAAEGELDELSTRKLVDLLLADYGEMPPPGTSRTLYVTGDGMCFTITGERL